VRPDCPVFYPRQHWAIETLLGSPEFDDLKWTSLQPNVFSPFVMASAAEFIKKYRKTGEQDTLRLILSEDAPVGIIDPDEVGIIAAHLLSQDDTSMHNKAKYVLNGPEDITGKQIVDMIEQHIGAHVKDVSFKDVSFIDMLYEYQYAATKQSKNVIYSIKRAAETSWEGKCSTSTTSPEILELAAPKRSPADTLKTLLEE
jgi:nucleoside-diphosphate-sugar epimerase